MQHLTVKSPERIGQVDAAAWDACAGGENPFLSHAFLTALEDSGSAVPRTGWAPRHLLFEEPDGRLLAAAPLYLKSHSYGEYVFDWGWAEAWERTGRSYYPKLQSAVPFTPVTGPRLLCRPGADPAWCERLLAETMAGMAGEAGLSSVHVTFLAEEPALRLEQAGWLHRLGEQYHWRNEGYETFDDFLGALSSRKRKSIRKEREKANAQGLVIETLTGDSLKSAHWDAFWGFYLDTSSRKWGQPYLTREFFARIGETMADRIVLMLASEEGRPVAGALNFLGRDCLYGRNWGALADYPCLHFEMCYYRAIDFAIEKGLARVEAGAQGEHKIARGYQPVATHSVHWIREAPFRQAVARFLAEERRQVAGRIEALEDAGPFRRESD